MGLSVSQNRYIYYYPQTQSATTKTNTNSDTPAVQTGNENSQQISGDDILKTMDAQARQNYL